MEYVSRACNTAGMLALAGSSTQKHRSSRFLLVACAVVGVTASGCNRTALQARLVDGAPPDAAPDVATDPVVEPVREDVAADAGPEHGPELRRDIRPQVEAGPEAPSDLPGEDRPEVAPEAAPDLREARAEIGRESGVEVGSEAGLEAGPESGASRDVTAETSSRDGDPECTRSTTTTTLAELEWPAAPAALAVRGDSVFVGISKAGVDTPPPVSAMVSVSVSTGQTKTFSLGNILPAWLTAGSDSLFYIEGKAMPNGAGSWRYNYPDVARLDLATGQVSVVDSELVPWGYTILSLAANPRGEVFWSMLADSIDSSSVLRRWDQASHSTMTIQTIEQPASVLADDDHLYWSGVNAAGRMAFFTVSTTGGPVSQIQEWSSDLTDPRVLRAVDDQSLYFLRPNATTKGIFAMPKGGGDSRAVVANVDPVSFGNQTIDDTHVYWIDGSDQTTIQRALKTGSGSIETISSDDPGGISDLAVDRCNIYWLPSGKPRVLVRGK